MKCNNCTARQLIKKGTRGLKQRYQCKKCGKYCQSNYRYHYYKEQDDKLLKQLNAEQMGIRSMSRVMGYSPATLIRRIKYLKTLVIKPFYHERGGCYEVDELWSYVGKNDPSFYSWIIYAMNRKTRQVIDVSFGQRTSKNLGKVIDSVKLLDPKKITTDKLAAYPNLIYPVDHDTTRYSNNRIERGNLTIRTHLKRFSRKTICFSRSQEMLEACFLLYLDHRNWCLKMS